MRGKRIVVTRAWHQAAELSELLHRRGAEPLLYPCIAIAPPQDLAPLDAALQAAVAGDVDWLVLTSTNTVLALAQRLAELGLAPAQLNGILVAAIGPATAAASQRLLGLDVQLIPEAYVAESLIKALRPASQRRILLPQADLARPILAQELAAAGAHVTAVAAYRTVLGTGGIDLPTLLAGREVDAITFTSPSTVHNFLRRLAAEGGHPSRVADVCLACIGPVTTQTAWELGLTVAVIPAQHTLEALVEGLEAHFRD